VGETGYDCDAVCGNNEPRDQYLASPDQQTQDSGRNSLPRLHPQIGRSLDNFCGQREINRMSLSHLEPSAAEGWPIGGGRIHRLGFWIALFSREFETSNCA
jgi:hypothetical protein